VVSGGSLRVHMVLGLRTAQHHRKVRGGEQPHSGGERRVAKWIEQGGRGGVEIGRRSLVLSHLPSAHEAQTGR